MARTQADITRTTLSVMFIGGLGLASIWIMRPFIAAIVWAATLVIATWPLMLRVERYLWRQRWLAVIVMTVALLIVVLVPFWLAIRTIIANAGRVVGFVQSADSFRVPAAPEWLATVPVVGASTAQAWNSISNLGIRDLTPELTPYLGRAAKLFIAALGSLGVVFVQFLLTVVIAAMMYARGEVGADLAKRFGFRLAGERGEASVRLVAQAIHGVALGVVVSSLIESLVGGVALAIVGVPLAAVLTALIFMACVSQIGPGLVLIPAVIWMYAVRAPGPATFLLVATLVVMVLDNLLRPMLMKRGAHLPLVLILAGVLGGVSGFGLVGIFLGPTILAVTYTLLLAWMRDGEPG